MKIFYAYLNKDIIGEANNGNNLAYIKEPASALTPANIATGINILLQTTSQGFKSYLLKNMGQNDAYNSGLMPLRHN